MTGHLEQAKALLAAGPYTCVVFADKVQLTSEANGVRALLTWLQTDADQLRAAAVADRVVGAAAAWLMLKAGFSQVHAQVISRPALAILQQAGLELSWDQLTERILNRAGDGLCPMEEACLGVEDAEEAYAAIQSTLARLAVQAQPKEAK